MQSIQARILYKCLKLIFQSPLLDNAKFSDFAGDKTKETKSRYRPSKNFTHSRHRCCEAYYEKLVSDNCNTEKVILLLHGGSFKVKLIDIYRKLAEKYSNLFDGATVINVDYRTFPQYEFPSQLEDAVNIYLEIIKTVEPENIIVIGDSAGANLVLTLSLWLRDNSKPMPGSIVCFSLWGDATSSGESRERNAYKDPFSGISKRKGIKDNLQYLHRISKYAQNLDRENPYVSPCFGSFENFPPVTLICGSAEMDESDSDTVYKKMQSAKVDVALYKFEGMFHDFQLFSFLPESKEAYRKVVQRINGGKQHEHFKHEQP